MRSCVLCDAKAKDTRYDTTIKINLFGCLSGSATFSAGLLLKGCFDLSLLLFVVGRTEAVDREDREEIIWLLQVHISCSNAIQAYLLVGGPMSSLGKRLLQAGMCASEVCPRN